jgi:hypothetical protein
MLATGSDEPSVARVQLLGGHLERFGQRRQLTVTWTPATPAPAGSTGDNRTAATGTQPFSPEESA